MLTIQPGHGRKLTAFHCSSPTNTVTDAAGLIVNSFQERRISRRCLYFCEDQLIFKCHAGVWREDIILEDPQVLACHDTVGLRDGSLVRLDASFTDLYIECLYRYANRDLTHEVDVVDAFSGVLDILVKSKEHADPAIPTSICGLPTIHFDWAILFDNSDERPPRRRHHDLPSWSWCGWKNAISSKENSLTQEELPELGRCQTWIRWYLHGTSRVDGSKHIVCFTPEQPAPDNSLFPPFKFPPMAGCLTTSLDLAVAHEVCRSPFGATLHFATLTVDLRLFPASSGKLASYYSIGKEPTKALGYIQLDERYFIPRPLSLYWFPALSVAGRQNIKSYYYAGVLDNPDACEAYNVMMVDIPQTDRMAVQRIDLGIIFRAGLDSDPGAEWREVWLR